MQRTSFQVIYANKSVTCKNSTLRSRGYDATILAGELMHLGIDIIEAHCCMKLIFFTHYNTIIMQHAATCYYNKEPYKRL